MLTSQFVDDTPSLKKMVINTSSMLTKQNQCHCQRRNGIENHCVVVSDNYPIAQSTWRKHPSKSPASSTCNYPSRPAKDAVILRMCTPPSLGHHQNSIPPPVGNAPKSAAVARAVDPMHSSKESKDFGYNKTAQLSIL